jgi:hypothetical protein
MDVRADTTQEAAEKSSRNCQRIINSILQELRSIGFGGFFCGTAKVVPFQNRPMKGALLTGGKSG